MEASRCLGLHLLILSFPCRTASGFPWAPVKWSGAPGVPETGDVAAWAYSDISSRCSARAGVSAVLQTQLGLGPLTLLGLPASFCSLLSSASLWSPSPQPLFVPCLYVSADRWNSICSPPPDPGSYPLWLCVPLCPTPSFWPWGSLIS